MKSSTRCLSLKGKLRIVTLCDIIMQSRRETYLSFCRAIFDAGGNLIALL